MDTSKNRKKIAEFTGWDLPRISRYFNGVTIPSVKHAREMAEAIDVDFNELCDFIINNNQKRLEVLKIGK